MKAIDLVTAGKSVKKIDSLSLATGRAKFVDDVHIPGLLIAKLVTSPHAHARIVEIDTSAAAKVPGVVCILTHKDLPRVPHTTAGQGYPEPSPYDTFILDDKVRFVGDRVCAIAAETRDAAERAARAVKVSYEVLPAVLDPEHAMDDGVPVIHDEPDALRIADPKRNLAAEAGFTLGKDFFEDADFIFDRTFITHYAQHTPIEPHICIAYFDEQDRLVLRTSTQVPFHARRIAAQSLRIPVKRIRVIKPRIGGGFGTKQEVLLEGIVGALALRTHRPVKLELTRAEETVSSRTRHPMVLHLRSGLKKDGTITDFDMDVINNTGAYGSHALTVGCNVGSKCLPLYRAKNVKFQVRGVYTNLPVGGAYRGYGATQGAFAMECLVDEMAERLGVDSLEFRKRSHIQEGETSPIFKAMGEGREGVAMTIQSCGLDRCIDLGAQEIDWYAKKKQPKGPGPVKRGLGCACLMQGSSIPGIDMGAASIKMNDDGSFNLLMGATDLGTGSDTVLAQIAAEVLGVRETDMIVYSSDTDMTPFDVGAYASSTTYLSGMAVKKAAEQVKTQILEVAGKMLEVDASKSVLRDGMVVLPNGRRLTLAEIAQQSLYIQDQFQIFGIASHVTSASPPPFSAHFCELEVDEETGHVKVLEYVAAVDCGTAINPRLAEGQTEGAVLNGISYALTEEICFDPKGRPRNPTFTHYKIFNSVDVPPIKTILVPTWEPTGPYGAKSVSEIGINGPLPAIANAIYDAIGIRLRETPFTPEKVLKALRLRARGRRLE
ncbi:MAG: molybdopterin-dependent oxidoreductase [Candidatus Riflebacteria bacterium]|nr:molybdopterin-dependent oxidoreductase [Candidatus Riflebacteria bacterium]